MTQKIKIPITYQEWEKLGLPDEGKPLMTSLSLIEAELLELIETKKKIYLGEVIENLNWPDPLILMSVGGLMRERQIIAERIDERILLTPKGS